MHASESMMIERLGADSAEAGKKADTVIRGANHGCCKLLGIVSI
jgi:hypothetical protein